MQARIQELDGLRGIAILLVWVGHYWIAPLVTVPGSLPAYLQAMGNALAWSGVDLFFVLSGFLIGGILIDNKDTPNYFKAFYARRVCRILPAYYLCMGLFLAAYLFIGPSASWLLGDPKPLTSYLVFTQNFFMGESFGANWLAPTWSVAVEEQFYLSLPLLVYLIRPAHLTWVLLITAATAPVCRLLMVGLYPYVLTICRMDALLIGVLLAILMRNDELLGRLVLKTKSLKILLIALSIISLILIALSRKSHILYSFSFTFVALAYAALLLDGLLFRDSLVSRVLRLKWLAMLGTLSYCVYLIHDAVNGLVHYALFRQHPTLGSMRVITATAVSFVLVLVLARLSWVYFESPIRKIGWQVKYDAHRTPKLDESLFSGDSLCGHLCDDPVASGRHVD